ncbi:hypothetical protein TWF696_005500 [Orbilia brochopaga]|uniref:Uncharacterized protein n=1 Tax=Orbilia brochopaga TaxID=3140254 RepID=A0AAV9V3N1_9PEZI
MHLPYIYILVSLALLAAAQAEPITTATATTTTATDTKGRPITATDIVFIVIFSIVTLLGGWALGRHIAVLQERHRRQVLERLNSPSDTTATCTCAQLEKSKAEEAKLEDEKEEAAPRLSGSTCGEV